jgi:hypothetical protein
MKRAASTQRALKRQLKLPLGVPTKHTVRCEFRKCGAVHCKTCSDGAGHGPYLYACWRDGKKVKRKYLGKG